MSAATGSSRRFVVAFLILSSSFRRWCSWASKYGGLTRTPVIQMCSFLVAKPLAPRIGSVGADAVDPIRDIRRKADVLRPPGATPESKISQTIRRWQTCLHRRWLLALPQGWYPRELPGPRGYAVRRKSDDSCPNVTGCEPDADRRRKVKRRIGISTFPPCISTT